MSHDLEQRLAAIESRNARVETDKAWEVSLTRKLCIMSITYILSSLTLGLVLRSDDWFLGAFIPVIGYWLSTLGLPLIRKRWERSR